MITNILLEKQGHNKQYLPKNGSAIEQPMFATANCAIRRKALDEIGLFDERCITGEDKDLGLRLSKTSWDLYFEKRAIIRHKFRVTFRSLMRQWYLYGRYHPYVFKKHHKKAIEFYWPVETGTGWRPIKIPFFFHILFMYNSFHFFHVSIFLLLLAVAIKSFVLLLISAAGVIYYGRCHFLGNFDFRKPKESFRFTAIRYLLNWAYVSGGFLGGLREGIIYLEATRESNPTTKKKGGHGTV